MRIIIIAVAFFLSLLFETGINEKNLKLSFEKEKIAYNSLKKIHKIPLFALAVLKIFKKKEGIWHIKKQCSLFELLMILQNPENKIKTYKITFIEGTTAAKLLEQINTSYLQGDCITELEEGSLFPDTYFYNECTSKKTLIATARAKMQATLNELWATRPQNFPLSKEEWIILASIIQKEGKSKEDFRNIASCFIWRLKKKWPLQSCVTIEYFLNKKFPNFEDIKTPSEYNTYLKRGLPPTPICIPSKDALIGVLEADLEWKFPYFNSHNGKIEFYKTLKEHAKARKYKK